MVLLMGTSYYLSSRGKTLNYPNYVIKRFNRLIIPTWIFLTIFFTVFLILALITRTNFEFGVKSIISSYALIGGIGYVWIMRVFFLIALVNPIILFCSNRVKCNMNYFVLLAIIYLVYLGIINVNLHLDGVARFIFENIILVSIGWGLIAAVGIRLKQLSRKELLLGASSFLLIFIFLMIKYNFESTQAYKYPPTMYYMSYGLFVSFVLLLILDIKCVYDFCDNRIVKYISLNSLTLYYWHIIPVYILDIYGDYLKMFNSNFISRFLFIFLFSMAGMVLQQNIFNRRCGIKVGN